MSKLLNFLTHYWLTVILLILSSMSSQAQNTFQMIALGSGGGIDESNLSSYLLSSSNSDRYICLDAGTLMHGLELASKKGHFDSLKQADQHLELPAIVLHQHIDSYLISHPHLDHISGMLLAGPFDNHKTIMCSQKTGDDLMKSIFQSNLWANFTTEGDHPLGKWEIKRMENNIWYEIPHNPMKVKTFALCHSCPNESSAFLIESEGNYCLYFGDTGADELEGEPRLEAIYKNISPLIRTQKLKAIFMEISFPNKQDSSRLFGHLKPQYFESEIANLANIVDPNNPKNALEGLIIFITHIKPDYQIENNSKSQIQKEINTIETYGAKLIIPQQSEKFEF